MKNYICIHGHFYQPPRENPWLETIEVQRSAAPFHDWNERIAAECYAPNRAARLLDAKGKITSLIDNYRHISFNFGPTLLLWLEREDPATYAAILAADRASRELYHGHGAAIAQAWGHIILPLANQRDKMTQIRWGVADFTKRFARPPEGMWLPEAAVDIESLELLAEEGIRFTILSPFQARRIRRLGEETWQQAEDGTIDSRHPYLCCLPSGRSIAIFFYDGSLARAVAFGGLLSSGDAFAAKLKAGLHPTTKSAQLVHLATDGESYGHHHKFGEMALARAIEHIQTDKSIQLTIYGAYLTAHPPQMEVEILPMSSWSCAHGVERWRSDCGCHIGTDPAWNQKWRAPLRDAFDHLRDQLIPLFENCAAEIFADPWGTRDAYIEVILDRSTAHVKRFLAKAAKHNLTPRQEQQGLQLLEMQHHTMQMYTSCGWFFDEVSGIETVQLLTYAARAIDLARSACAVDLEESFREMLRLVPSNLRRWRDAEAIYAEVVMPQRIDLRQVAANYAIAILLGGNPAEEFYCYTLHCEHQRQSNGNRGLVTGRIRIYSQITWEEKEFTFAALHFGGLDVLAGVKDNALLTEPKEKASLQRLLDHGDQLEAAIDLKKLFGAHLYSLTDLFIDERQRTVNRMISAQVARILEEFNQIYRDHLGLLQFLHENSLPVPAPLSAAAEQLLNEEIHSYLENDEAFSGRVREKVEGAQAFDLKLDRALLAHAASRSSHSRLLALAAAPDDPQRLMQTIKDLEELLTLPWPIDLWQAQNIYFDIRHQVIPVKLTALKQNDAATAKWLQHFETLGNIIGINPNIPA